MAQQGPQMDQQTCKQALQDAIAAFSVPANKDRILAVLAEVNALPADQQMMMRMMKVMPVVQEIQQNALAKYGFDFPGGAMQAMMQIQLASQTDPEMGEQVKQLMSMATGNV
jgi:hypothetical protein